MNKIEYVIDKIAEMPTNINLQYENRGKMFIYIVSMPQLIITYEPGAKIVYLHLI